MMRKDQEFFDGTRGIADIPRETFTLPTRDNISAAIAELNQAPAAQHDEMVERETMLHS